MSNNIVVLSGKEEYRNEVKSYLENFLCLDNICLIEADHALANPGIIERLEEEHRQGKTVVVVGGYRRERGFLEIISWASDFFRKERVFWAENIRDIKNLKSKLKNNG